MRKRLSPTTGIAVAALVLAMSGGAYAASTLITGHQIAHHTIGASNLKKGTIGLASLSPSLRKKLSTVNQLSQVAGPAGATGPAGANGAAGPAGATGASGAKGATGSSGTNGSNGADGATGATGPQGAKGDKGDQGDPGTNGNDGATGPQGAKGDTGDQGDPGTNGNDGATGPQGAKGDQGDPGTNGLNPALPVLANGDQGWHIDDATAGVDPASGNGAAYEGGALHLYGGFDSNTAQGGIGIAKTFNSPALSTLSAIGYSFVINSSSNSDQPVVHVSIAGPGISGSAIPDSKFGTGFTNLVYVPAFNGVTPGTGVQATVDGFDHGNLWYSTDEPGGISPTNKGSQDDPQPISYFIGNDPTAVILQIAVDNGNSSSGTIPYAGEDFSVDNLIVGFNGSFTRYDLGG